MPVEVFTTMRTASNTRLELNEKIGSVEHGFQTNLARVYLDITYDGPAKEGPAYAG